MSAISEKLREEFKKSDDIRDKGLTTPKEILRYDDILYGKNKAWQKLDVYRPKKAKGKLPVIISVHGGGWVYGDKERYQYYCMDLAKRGFAVVNFTYRLAPDYKFPSSIEDTNSVVKWVLKNAEEYQLDTDHVFAVGDSAGAHNLSLYTSILTNKEYAKNYAFRTPKNFCFRAIALNCGSYNVKISGKNSLTRMLMADYLPEKGSKKELELLCCIDHITENYPPVFVMTAVGDFLKDQAIEIVKKLTEKNIPHVFRLYGDSNNRLGHVFHCNIRSKDAALCNDEECDFFKKFI